MDPDGTTRRNRWLDRQGVEGDAYDVQYIEREKAGENVHGEADFVEAFRPKSVLDAGCGTGRVAIELARRGIATVGVDVDPRMLETARRKAPHLEWHQGDLSTIDLDRQFDAIVMAGNVMIFVTGGTEGEVLRNMARHMSPGGLLISGFQLGTGYLSIGEYDHLAEAAGLELLERWSTWQRDPWDASSTYALNVHRLGR